MLLTYIGDTGHLLMAIGAGTAIWSLFLTLYAVISASRQRNASLRAVRESFAILLMNRGDDLRRTGDIANAITRNPR